MQRYDGRPLGPKPHIAVLGSCKVGNFVVTLPMLRSLRKRYPAATLDFWGSEQTADFEEALCRPQPRCEGSLLNWRISWDSCVDDWFQTLAAAAKERGHPDLVINCDGFNPLTQVLASWLRPCWVAGGALTSNGRRELDWGEKPQQKFLADKDWDSPAFIARYKEHFQSNYIAELLCRMAFLEPSEQELKNIELPWKQPNFSVPDLLIHCTTTRTAKIWPLESWSSVLKWCQSQKLTAGLVGAAPTLQTQEYHSGDLETELLNRFGQTKHSQGVDRSLIDLRGKTSLIELAGACRNAKAVISVDAGPLHIAAAVGTPVLAVVGNDAEGLGASPIRLWLPRSNQLTRTVSSVSCSGCDDRRFRNEACVEELHACMNGVLPQQVTDWLKTVLER